MRPNQDFNEIHYDVNQWQEFNWVKACRKYSNGGWSSWQWMKVNDLLEFRRKRKSTLIFHTIGHFREQDTEAEQLSDLCFECDVGGETDFERRQNFQRMQNTVDELYRFFADLGIEDGQIRFWFTGGRSIHVVVMHQPFGVEPAVELNLVMKHIASYFNHSILDGDEYLPLDESLYANPKQFRMPNSYYPKYDAWKIEISPNEFDLPEAKLRELAKEPRPSLYDLSDISTDPVPDAVEWYQERLQEFQELEKEREHIPTNIKALQELTDIPACIADLRTNTISTEGIRNQATLLDATFCKSTKVEKSDAIAIIDGWVQHIPEYLTSTKPGRPRTIATKSVVESVYRNPKYKFACGYALALGLECNKEACPLYNKKAFQRWNKRVKVIPNFEPTVINEFVPIDTLRSKLSETITENGNDVLLHIPPGGGKTETTLKTIEAAHNVIYSASRRELLDSPMNLIVSSACQLIRPRGPIGPKPGKDASPGEQEAYKATALCPYYQHADALAAKRWNVAKYLCSKCDIGMTTCKYWIQYKVAGSCCITHQILFIPKHMESLIANNEPTIIFDEPNPQSFIEQVNITPKILTDEMERNRNPDVVKFLEVIRTVVEKHTDVKTTYIGKAIIDKILSVDANFEKTLSAVAEYVDIPGDYVEIEVDGISAQSTDKAWLVIIDNKEYWIPRSICFETELDYDDPEPINDETIKDGNWRPYQYREDETGNGYAVEVREYKDKRLNLLLKTYREYEIAQAAHRIRPLLYPGQKKIWLLTNLPIDELPPTRVTDLAELKAETDPAFLQFVETIKAIVAEYSGVWNELLVLISSQNMVEFSELPNCTSIYNLVQNGNSENYIRKTMFYQLERAVKVLNYKATTIAIGGNVRLKVYHDGNLDQDKIREVYQQIQEAINEKE